MKGWLILGGLAAAALALRSRSAAAVAVAQRQLARDGAWPEHVAPTLEVVDVRPHIFADSCLGVPGPDEVCTQAVTPGYLVQLRVMGLVFEYHVAGDRARLCPPCSTRLSRAG